MWSQKRQTEASRARSQERSQRPEAREPEAQEKPPKPPKAPPGPKRGGGVRKKNPRVHKGISGEGLRRKGYFSISPPPWAPPLPRSWYIFPAFSSSWGCVVVAWGLLLGLCCCCCPCPVPCPAPCPAPALPHALPLALPLPCPAEETCNSRPLLAETLQV